jgi:hypothetical protein
MARSLPSQRNRWDTARMSTSVESGELGALVQHLVVEACRLVFTHFLMESNVVLTVLMVMETRISVLAILRNARLIAKASGMSTAHVPPLVVVEPRPVCSKSPGQPRMVAHLAISQLVTWISTLAARNNASGIARATGTTGASAKVLVEHGVVWVAHRVAPS